MQTIQMQYFHTKKFWHQCSQQLLTNQDALNPKWIESKIKLGEVDWLWEWLWIETHSKCCLDALHNSTLC
jgi:hypothetical protein